MNFKYTLVMVLALSCCKMGINAMMTIEEIIHNLNQRIDSIVEEMDLNKSLHEIIGEMRNITRNLNDIASCFVSEVNGRSLNIFDDGLNFSAVVDFYYKAFPMNEISNTSILNLLNSTKEMIERCIDNQNSTIQYGYTEMSDKSVDELKTAKGINLDLIDEMNNSSKSKRMTGSDEKCLPSSSRNLPSSLDWRNQGVVTPVKNQGRCGSCWIFAALGSIESTYLLNGKTKNTHFDLSEQQLVDCARDNGCNGGTSKMAFEYVKNNFATYERYLQYRARNSQCPSNIDEYPEAASIKNYCIRSRLHYSNGFQTEELSDEDIQSALVEFGPLYIGIDSNPLISRNYRGGVMDDSSCTKDINHAVVLVGYTPDAWIVKNSWGRGWGEDGYFRMVRNKNMCGINTEIAYGILE